MIGVIVAAHGGLAAALLATAKSAIPNPELVRAIGIEAQDDAQSFERRLREAVAALLEEADGVLVLTDMFGGSPSNIGMTLHKEGRVEILTGANLPMLIKVLQSRLLGLPLATVAEHGRASALRSIAIASEVLGGTAATESSKASPPDRSLRASRTASSQGAKRRLAPLASQQAPHC